MFSEHKLRVIVIFVAVIALLSATCYAGIRVKPLGKDIILSPGDSYIVSETVVEDGRLVSDKIIEHKIVDFKIGVKEVPVKPVKLTRPSKASKLSQPSTQASHQPSIFSRVLHRWRIRLLDMFVCNVKEY